MGFLALRQFSVRVPSVHVPSVSQCPLEEITVRLRGPRSRQQQLQKEVIAAGDLHLVYDPTLEILPGF